MQWRVFGAAGHKKRPAGGGPLKNYDKCIHHQGFNNMYGKSIVNMFWVKKTSNAHAFMYRCALLTSPAFAVRSPAWPAYAFHSARA